jgi:Ser-tRNA(Ala) deacylase AlaX
MSQQLLKTDDAEEKATAVASNTESLYLQDTYLLEASACIVRVSEEIQSKHGKHCVAVDRTVFHPQGGGQP